MKTLLRFFRVFFFLRHILGGTNTEPQTGVWISRVAVTYELYRFHSLQRELE